MESESNNAHHSIRGDGPLVYISKTLNHELRIKAIRALFNLVSVASTTKQDLEKAMQLSQFDDLEDALQLQCLIKIKGDYLVTRDKKFLKLCDKAISPGEFLSCVGGTE